MSLVAKESYFSLLKYSWTWSKHGQRVSITWLPLCREWVHGAGDQRTWLINLLSLSWNWCDLYLALSYFLGLGIMRLVWFVSCLILLLCARYHETGAIDISPLCAVVDEAVVDFVAQSCTVGRRLQMTCRDVHSLAPHLPIFRLLKLLVWRIQPPPLCWQRSCNPKSPNSLELLLGAPAVVGSGRNQVKMFGQWVTKREKTKTTIMLVIIVSVFEKQR